MFVKDVMTTPVISIEPSAIVAQAARLMLAQRISGLPVVRRDGALVGVISEGDLLRRSELGTEIQRPHWLEFFVSPGKAADEYVHAHGRKVDEVMTRAPVTIEPSAPLEEAVEMMTRQRIKRLPVVGEGKLVGILARSDVMRALARALPGAGAVSSGTGTARAVSDAQIRADVLAEFAKQSWGHNLIRVHVEGGVVDLSGTILDERERLAARVAAENVRGVTAVVDHLVWIEPVSGIVILPAEDNTAGLAAAASHG